MKTDPRITRELGTVVLASIGIAIPFVVGVIAGDRSHDVPLEPRYAAVIGVACLASVIAFAIGFEGRVRSASAALIAFPILHFAFSASPFVAAIDVAVLLATAATTMTRAGVRIARLPIPRGPRIAAIVFLVCWAPGPLLTLAWGLASTTLVPAIVRLGHGSPEIGVGERAVSFASRDGTVLRATFTPGKPNAPGIVLVHGLADSRRRLVPWARELARHGAHVLRIDLRAHGVSDGVALTFADREPDDVEAALRYLASQPGVGELHALGVSMGGGATLAAVSRPSIDVTSTVLLAPVTDYRPLVERRLPSFEPLHTISESMVRGVTHGLGHLSPLELVPADAALAAGPARILVLHSRTDRTVPPSITEALASRAPWIEVEWLDDVRHVDMPEHTLRGIETRDRIVRFLGL